MAAILFFIIRSCTIILTSHLTTREPGTEANEWVCVFVSPPMEINSYPRTLNFVIVFLGLISLRSSKKITKNNQDIIIGDKIHGP